MKHGDLVNLCLLELAPRGMAWPNATGGYMAGGRLFRYGLKGSSDILACINGRFVGVECKAGRDTVKKHQRAFGDALERAGGVYIVARSVDDVRERLAAEGLV